MKAAICTRYGPPEVIKIEERLKPVLKDDSVNPYQSYNCLLVTAVFEI